MVGHERILLLVRHTAKGKFCMSNANDTDPPRPMSVLDEECGDCNQAPRWATTPQVWRKFGVYDPGDPRNKKQRQRAGRGLIFGRPLP